MANHRNVAGAQRQGHCYRSWYEVPCDTRHCLREGGNGARFRVHRSREKSKRDNFNHLALAAFPRTFQNVQSSHLAVEYLRHRFDTRHDLDRSRGRMKLSDGVGNPAIRRPNLRTPLACVFNLRLLSLPPRSGCTCAHTLRASFPCADLMVAVFLNFGSYFGSCSQILQVTVSLALFFKKY